MKTTSSSVKKFAQLLTPSLPVIAAGLAVLTTSPASYAAADPEPVLTISIPSVIFLGDSATVIVNAKHNGTNIANLPISQIKIHYPLDPGTNLPLGDSVLLVNAPDGELTDANGNLSVPFDPQSLSIPANCGYKIEAKSKNTSAFKSSSSTLVDFCIREESCGDPFTFALTDVSGSGELLVSTKSTANVGTWDLTYTVKACTAIVAGTKVQGGLAGWLAYQGCAVSTGSYEASAKNRNVVITWTLPALLPGDEETITISVSGSSKTLGTQPLSGAWSAVYQTLEEANNVDPITGLPAPIPPHKTAYTPRATVEVVTELTP